MTMDFMETVHILWYTHRQTQIFFSNDKSDQSYRWSTNSMFAISKKVETIFFFFNSILHFKFNFLDPYYMQVIY